MENQSFIEKVFEGGLWNLRFVVLLAVMFSALAAVALFILGSYDIGAEIYCQINASLGETKSDDVQAALLSKFIGAIDLYLIGIVLLIFSFGVYELFISKIDIARKHPELAILEIENLDELKNKIIKVIIMVLIVSFFKRMIDITKEYNTPTEMLYFSLSILALAVGVFLIKKRH